MATRNQSDSEEKRSTRRGRVLLSFALVLVFLLGIGVRLVDLQDPPLDFHAVRQLRSALISRSIYYNQSPDYSLDQKQTAAELASLEVYEPPILETIVASIYLVIGAEKLWISRVLLSLFWAAGGLAIWLIMRRVTGNLAALCSLGVYFFLPFSVIASRSFQPEPFMVMWIVLFVLVIDRWTEKQNWQLTLLAGFVAGVAIIVKVVAALYILPVLGCIGLFRIGLYKSLRSIKLWMITTAALLPSLIYYGVFQTERSGSFMSFWSTAFSWMLLTSNFYADWLAMVKGLTGLFLFTIALIGLVIADQRYRPLLLGMWIGYGLYGLVFPYQYVTHEYYHLPLVALVALSLSPVFSFLIQKIGQQPIMWKYAGAGIIVFTMFYNLWVSRSILIATDYSLEPASWKQVGEAIPGNSSIVALTGDSGMRLRYYGWRKADIWPADVDFNLRDLADAQDTPFEVLFEQYAEGKDYFLVTALSQFDNQPELKAYLNDHFPVSQGNGYLVYDMH